MRRLVFASLCGLLLTGCTDPVVRVDGFSWERSIEIEAFQEVSESGWELPQGATPIRTSERFHHHQTVTCVGLYYDLLAAKWRFGKHKCQESVNQTWYEYNVHRWIAIRRVTLRRSDPEPQWPEVVLSEGEREGSREEAYWVQFSRNNSVFSFQCEESQWRSLKEKAYYRADIVGGEIKAIHEEIPLEKSDGS